MRFFPWDAMRDDPPPESLADADAIVNLAGDPVAQRWTREARRRIRESRVAGTRRLVQALARLEKKPGLLVSGSAIGYYGSRADEELAEASAPGGDFLAEVCAAWEAEADRAEALGVRVVKVRIGLVLGKGGGALERMTPPFKLGVGGNLGSGRQWMSWIHMEDLVGLTRFVLEQPLLKGPVNATSPHPVRNAEFTKALASALHRPAFLPAPAFAIRALFGEMAEMLLASQRVAPRAAQNAGYAFKYPELAGALQSLFPA